MAFTPDLKDIQSIRVNEKYGTGVIGASGVSGLSIAQKKSNIMILPSTGLTYQQLVDFLPRENDIFSIDRLMKWNPQLKLHAGKRGALVECTIEEKGIIGTLVIGGEL